MFFVSYTMQKYKKLSNCQQKNGSFLQDETNCKGICYISKYRCRENVVPLQTEFINTKPIH